MASSSADGIPVERVLAVYERWQKRDEDEHTQQNAASRTGHDAKWFQRLRTEPDRDVPFDAVDRMVTNLDLEHEWPALMDMDAPADPALEDRLCKSCDRRVLGEVEKPHACVWCGSPTRKAPPRRHDLGPKKISMTVLLEARKLYETPMPMSDVARIVWTSTDYASVMSCRTGLTTAFRALGWRVRKGQLPGSGFKQGENWRSGSEELLEEARRHYESGYNMLQVARMMWPRTKYKSPEQAAKTWSVAFRQRGWRLRSRSEVRRGLGVTHGMYVRNDPDEIRAFRRELYYRDKVKCAHEKCPWFVRPGGHPTLCRRHDESAQETYEAAKVKRAQTRGYVELGTIRHILVAWKGLGKGGVIGLHRASGVPNATLTRWINRCPDDQLIRPEYAEQVHAAGLPPER